jgi:preprotein translocase subunit YajC
MFISPAYAQDALGGGTTGVLMQLLPLILIFAVFYFLLIRPQQTTMKQHKAMLGALTRNDRIITAGGVIGTVTKVRDDAEEVEVEIAQGVRITVVRSTIASVIKPPEPANDAAKA